MGRVRLTNLEQPKKSLSISSEAWNRSLELAEEYGWQPLGAYWPDVLDETVDGFGYEVLREESDDWEQGSGGAGEDGGERQRLGTGYPAGSGQVELVTVVTQEDALSMADALQQAALEYEPEPVYKLQGTFLAQLLHLEARTRPSLGAITAMLEFCRMGGFRVERY